MTVEPDTVVIGGDLDGLAAAVSLAQRGSKVLLLEEHESLGGAHRDIEFAPGFRAAPLGPDLGCWPTEVLQTLGLNPSLAAPSDPVWIALSDTPPLLLRSSVEQTAGEIRKFSAKDAQRWPDFAARMQALAQFLGELYRLPAPQIEGNTRGELFALLGLGRKYRALGRAGMLDLLRTLPMSLADLLDDWFESDRLKGALAAVGVMDVCQGPMSGGTAFTLLHRHVGAHAGVFNERVRLADGGSSLASLLARCAAAAGVTVKTNTAVSRLDVRDGRVAGVVLASGETVSCRKVVSSLDPYRSLLELLDPVYLDPELIHAVRNIRFRGVSTKILLALDSLPPVPGASGPVSGAVMIAPSIRYVERAYDATKYGRCADEPFVEVRFPSVSDAKLAPAGKHVAVVHVQFTPFQLRDQSWEDVRDRVAERALAIVERHMPGFASRIRERVVLSPADLQARFGVREGAVSQGEMMLDQILFMRPVPGVSRYATPMPGYFICGAGTHPGAGINGLSGLLAARVAAASK